MGETPKPPARPAGAGARVLCLTRPTDPGWAEVALPRRLRRPPRGPRPLRDEGRRQRHLAGDPLARVALGGARPHRRRRGRAPPLPRGPLAARAARRRPGPPRGDTYAAGSPPRPRRAPKRACRRGARSPIGSSSAPSSRRARASASASSPTRSPPAATRSPPSTRSCSPARRGTTRRSSTSRPKSRGDAPASRERLAELARTEGEIAKPASASGPACTAEVRRALEATVRWPHGRPPRDPRP